MTNSHIAPHSANAGAVPPDRILVWDGAVRAFHWSLVAAVAVAVATGFLEWGWLLDIHIIAGTIVGGLILLRLIWGFTGTTYARFRSFVVSPRTLIRHVVAMRRGEAAPHVGHNPVGGWMILALIATLTLLTVTGAVVLGGVLKSGPLAPFASFATGRAAKEIHELLAFGLLALVMMHVAGILAESMRTRDNLVGAMLRGWKPHRVNAHAAVSARARPVLAASLAAAALLAVAAGVLQLSRLPVPGLPTAALDPVYAKECGSCHSAHNPSLASSATWGALMRGLDNHFGENASLDEPIAKALATYLTGNSAEHWDTQAAARLAKPDEKQPLRITATKGWQRFHRHVAAAVFERKSVGGRLNCARCHRDADVGRFDPRAIIIPEEKRAP